MVKVLNYLRLEREAENFVGLMQVTLLQVHLDGNRRHGNRIFASAAELGEDCGQHEAVPSVERSYIAKETLGDILDYLATMSVEAQRLFHLRFVSDLSYAEIGMITGVTEACARQQVRKLRQKLVQRPQIDGASPSRGALRHVIPNEDRV
jgi:RNA polymerase sigma factor (sigma-70 family)